MLPVPTEAAEEQCGRRGAVGLLCLCGGGGVPSPQAVLCQRQRNTGTVYMYVILWGGGGANHILSFF